MDRNELFVFTDITDEDIDRMVEEYRTHTEEGEAESPVIAPFEDELDKVVTRAQSSASTAPTFADAFFKLDAVTPSQNHTAPAAVETAVTPSEEGAAQDAPATDSEAVAAPSPKQRGRERRQKTAPSADSVATAQDVSAEDGVFTDDTPVIAEKASSEEVSATPSSDTPDKTKRNGFMRFLGEIVPHVGDSAFDIIRKCVMLIAIVVFVGAGTYLLDDLVIVPVQNEILVDSLQSLYDPDNTAPLTPEEENYTYPEGMDPSFKKLYYQNNDVRGWISFHSTDNNTIICDYPIVQSTDNDYYLHRDYYGTYNKNGTLFYDYRNVIATDAANKNTIIYGHNMLSGQMFAGLNRLPLGLTFARTSPSFTMNTLYQKGTYKVFAVMVIDPEPSEGVLFDYLRTDFTDNVEFATFLSEILARSLYVYGDVDISPDDEIVTLSTCGEEHAMKFKNSRTVVVARKVREGEDPATDVSKITVNEDVIMPLAWYRGNKQPIHTFYTDVNYVIQPLDGILEYIATSTQDPNATTPPTEFPFYFQDGTFGLIVSRSTIPLSTGATEPYPQSIRFLSGRTSYTQGEAFDAAGTKFRVTLSDGSHSDITAEQCMIDGFSSATPGKCKVTFRYTSVQVRLTLTITPKDPVVVPPAPTTTTKAPTAPPTKPTTTTTPPTKPTTTTAPPTEPPTESSTTPTTVTTAPPEEPVVAPEVQDTGE